MSKKTFKTNILLWILSVFISENAPFIVHKTFIKTIKAVEEMKTMALFRSSNNTKIIKLFFMLYVVKSNHYFHYSRKVLLVF